MHRPRRAHSQTRLFRLLAQRPSRGVCATRIRRFTDLRGASPSAMSAGAPSIRPSGVSRGSGEGDAPVPAAAAAAAMRLAVRPALALVARCSGTAGVSGLAAAMPCTTLDTWRAAAASAAPASSSPASPPQSSPPPPSSDQPPLPSPPPPPGAATDGDPPLPLPAAADTARRMRAAVPPMDPDHAAFSGTPSTGVNSKRGAGAAGPEGVGRRKPRAVSGTPSIGVNVAAGVGAGGGRRRGRDRSSGTPSMGDQRLGLAPAGGAGVAAAASAAAAAAAACAAATRCCSSHAAAAPSRPDRSSATARLRAGTRPEPALLRHVRARGATCSTTGASGCWGAAAAVAASAAATALVAAGDTSAEAAAAAAAGAAVARLLSAGRAARVPVWGGGSAVRQVRPRATARAMRVLPRRAAPRRAGVVARRAAPARAPRPRAPHLRSAPRP
jgi:hypothetical protein